MSAALSRATAGRGGSVVGPRGQSPGASTRQSGPAIAYLGSPRPSFSNLFGGKSLGTRLAKQDHWYTDALNKVLDVTTLGAKPRIDAAYDARAAGLISDDAYWGGV